MHEQNYADRRTVLQATAAALAGGGLATGTTTAREHAHGEGRGQRNRIEIVATHDHGTDEHLFELGRTEIEAGWTTIEFANQTAHAHFAYLAKVPQAAIDAADAADRDLLDFYVERVTEPFQGFLDSLLGEEPRHDPALPEWFGDVRPSGGPGLTAGHLTSTTTVDLAPGEYIVECYVKNDANEFHSYEGMIDLLSVTEGDDPAGREPVGTLELSLSVADREAGIGSIDAADTVRPGRHTVAVTVESQQLYEHLLGHDVHLLRYEGETSTSDVTRWMNWMDPRGLVSDGSEPATFLGGVQTILTPALLEGVGPETAYLHVTLEPGDYAWVSEVPSPDETGLLAEFTVPAGRVGGGPP